MFFFWSLLLNSQPISYWSSPNHPKRAHLLTVWACRFWWSFFIFRLVHAWSRKVNSLESKDKLHLWQKLVYFFLFSLICFTFFFFYWCRCCCFYCNYVDVVFFLICSLGKISFRNKCLQKSYRLKWVSRSNILLMLGIQTLHKLKMTFHFFGEKVSVFF